MEKGKRERIGLDARGLPVVEERIGTGQYRPLDLDSTAVRLLKADQLSLAEPRPLQVRDSPYGNNGQAKSLKARSRLDYMRALSENIKANRRAAGSLPSPESPLKVIVSRLLRRRSRGR